MVNKILNGEMMLLNKLCEQEPYRRFNSITVLNSPLIHEQLFQQRHSYMIIAYEKNEYGYHNPNWNLP